MTTTLSLKDLTIVKNEICPIIEIFLNDPTKIQPFSFAIKSGDDKIDVDLEFIKNSLTLEYEIWVNVGSIPDMYNSRTGVLDIQLFISCADDCIITRDDVRLVNMDDLGNIEFENLPQEIVDIWNKS